MNKGTPAKTERNDAVYKMHLEGKFPTEISRAFGISVSRAYQIVKARKKKEKQ